jgi:hypothetical protein
MSDRSMMTLLKWWIVPFLIIHELAFVICILLFKENPSNPDIGWGGIQSILTYVDFPIFIAMIIFQNVLGSNWMNNMVTMMIGGTIMWVIIYVITALIYRAVSKPDTGLTSR